MIGIVLLLGISVLLGVGLMALVFLLWRQVISLTVSASYLVLALQRAVWTSW